MDLEALAQSLSEDQAVELYELLSDRLGEDPDMMCERCHGKGTLVGEVTIHQGNSLAITLPEIQGVCPDCRGMRVIHCCEGDREQAMLNAIEHPSPRPKQEICPI